MDRRRGRLRAVRWESQETIVIIDDTPFVEAERRNSSSYGSEETIAIAGSANRGKRSSATGSKEAILPSNDAPFDPEGNDINLERLGRQRPECLHTAFREFAFCFSIITSMVMAEYFVSGAHIILPSLTTSLDIPRASQTWVSSVLSLSAGASLLPLGRLADMHGGYPVFNAGMLWFSAWSLAAGFMTSPVPFIVCRAMQGLGASAFLPTGIMLLGRVYRPGPRKNFVFGMYGAIAPAGFWAGMIVGGVAAEKLTWRWFFWIGSAASFVAAGVSIVAVPRDKGAPGVTMDWWGLGTICPGLVLLVFAITQSSGAPKGWGEPYIIASVVLGVLFLIAGWYVEGRVSPDPFLPAEIFKPKCMKQMLIALFLAYGTFGIFLYYSNFYIELVLEISPLNTALWYIPWCISGIIFASLSGVVLHLIPGRILLVASAVFALAAALFFALMPEKVNYWGHVLPAMITQTAFIDILYTTSNVFITTRLPRRHQGLAGALINCTLYVGMCLFLGIADTAVAASKARGLGQRRSFQVAFWMIVGISVVVMIIFAFVDIGAAGSELTADEKKARMEAEAGGTRMESLPSPSPSPSATASSSS